MPSDRKKAPRFPNTRWSLVGRAAAPDDLTRQKALEELIVAYLPGLRSFLIEARRIPPDLADDLLNGFIADKVLAAGLVRHADQGRGKFRNFILKSLNHFVTSKLRGEYITRARAGGLDEHSIAAPPPAVTDRFDREWVQQVVRDALQMMEADCKKNARPDIWEMFRLRVADPMLHDVEPADYAQIVARLGLASPRQAINLLATAKRAFLAHVEAAVGKYVQHDKIQAEIADLRQIVSR